MQKSKFSFTEPSLVSVTFNYNKNFDPSSHQEIECHNKFQFQINRNDNAKQALFTLKLSINDDENIDVPFLLIGCIESLFSWEDDCKSDEIDHFFTYDAPELLLSYIRPIVSSITGFSGLPNYVLPYLDIDASNFQKAVN